MRKNDFNRNEIKILLLTTGSEVTPPTVTFPLYNTSAERPYPLTIQTCHIPTPDTAEFEDTCTAVEYNPALIVLKLSGHELSKSQSETRLL